MSYRFKATVGLILLIFNIISAQNETETRNFIKTFSVSHETTLELTNKYGTIQITPWNKDSAYIRAEIKAYGKDRSKLSKMFDGISVDMDDSKYLIRARTEFTSNINTLFESFKGMTSKIISYDSKLEINYYVSIPEYLNLKIDNKYGDVYMENCSGEFRATVSNGSFKAGSLSKNTSLNLVFCDAKINSIASGSLDASFSELSLGETGDLSINSISSKYDIRKAGSLRGESKRDKLFIDEIESLQGNAYFTDYKIEKLTRSMTLTARYGNVNADMIDKGFEDISVNSNFSDVDLIFEPGTSYNYDIRQTNAFVVMPDRNINTSRKDLDENRKEYLTSGYVGKNTARGRVKIEATRGNIYLK
jgi:hypothetical protein